VKVKQKQKQSTTRAKKAYPGQKKNKKQKATINLCGSQAADGNLEDKQKKISK